MEQQFFMGMKNNMHYLLKQLLIVILIWMGICTILAKSLFSYYESFVQKKDTKIIYEIKPATTQLKVPLNR